MKYLLVGMIKIYQLIPGPWHDMCRYTPTCSEYAILVIKKYGTIIGTFKTWRRLKYYCRGDVYYIDEP